MIFFGVLYGLLIGGVSSVGWWMFFYFYAYGIVSEYFISYIFGSWFFYEYDCVFVNYDRLEECLYLLVRFRSNMMNGVNFFSVFGSGSGIFYFLLISF